MAGVPQVNFALDTYECIVIYPGAAGRALPAETVQRLQAEHAEHMQALQRSGIVLVAGSMDGPAREPGATDRLRAGPHRQRRRRPQRAGGRPGGAGRALPGGRADLPLPGRFAGVSAGQDGELTGRSIGGCRDGDGARRPAGVTVAPSEGRRRGAPGKPWVGPGRGVAMISAATPDVARATTRLRALLGDRLHEPGDPRLRHHHAGSGTAPCTAAPS